jgi:hypothetical protein
MTKMLRAAFDAASRLPPDEQNAIAAALLADIEGELRWDETLDKTGERLTALGDEAIDEDREGRTEPLDPDEL